MFLGNPNAVAHDKNDFGDVTAEIVVILTGFTFLCQSMS